MPRIGRMSLLLPLLGLVASVGAAWLATRSEPSLAREREATLRAELETLSDSRVELVIRQFEWAVNDVETLRQQLKRSELAKRQAETRVGELERRGWQYRQMLERAQVELAAHEAEPIRLPEAPIEPRRSTAVALRWSLHDDGTLQRVRLETEEPDAARVRLLDADGHVVTISDPATPASPRLDGRIGMAFEMVVPPHVVADLAAASLTKNLFQALVRDEWREVTLADTGVRTGAANPLNSGGRYAVRSA